MSPAPPDRQQLQDTLDELAHRSRRFLTRWFLRRDLRLTARDALVWLPAGPAVLLAIQAVSALTGRPAPGWPLWMWALAAVAGPVLWVAARVGWQHAQRRIDRRSAIGLFDTQLATKDRLVTADEFLAGAEQEPDPHTRRFMQAAIDDAAPYAQQAMVTQPEPRALPDWQVSRRSWAAAAAAIALMLLAVRLGPASSSAQAAPVQEGIIAAADPGTTAAKPASKLLDLFRPRPRAEKRAEDERTIASDLRQTSESSSRATRSEEEAAGQSQSGRQANTRSSNNANNSSGTPSNQKTPSKAADEDEPQDEPKPDAKDRPKTPEAKKAEEQQASSSTSGQGQSKSSSSDTSNIPADDQPDRAGGNKEDDVDEEGIQDEVEEEKTSGVERPSLRKNKPPVDRNLSPLPTGDEPSPTANGRSGPGGRKKTRGVPAMILGVPVPDRIQGMKNPGRSKVTQENSTPKEEPQASLNAESRQPREAAFGPVEHPLLLPWMQSLVRQYFLQLRETPKAQR